MAHSMRPLFRKMLGATALALTLAAAPAMAETIFTPSNDGFSGQVRAASSTAGSAIHAGSSAVLNGQGLIPGQEITLMRGTKVLTEAGPLVVDADGKFSFEIAIDADAVTGLQPILVIAEKPAAATVVDLKISPNLAVTGADKFTIISEPVSRGLYQVQYSEKSNAAFTASAVGRPPVKESAISKIDPETLKVIAQVTPPEAPAVNRPGQAAAADDGRPPLFAAYGLGVDDANGNIWITNTRQNTISVYAQSDLSLVKQFEPGTVNHSRDVVIDAANNRAYVSATFTNQIEVFDTKTLEKLEPIVIKSSKRGGEFSTMSLDIDTVNGKLATVSMTTDEAAVVDLATGEMKVFALAGAKGASGVAFDAKENLLFIVSQSTDNLLIVKADTGEVLHDVETGAGALNVTFEPVARLAYVANRGAGTITVVDTAGQVVANIDAGAMPNQLRADGKGNVWAVNKSRGQNDEVGDRIWKITPIAQ